MQECLLHWFFIKDQNKISEERSYKFFMETVIKNKLFDIARKEERHKRKTFYRSVSLDELIGEDDEETFIECLTTTEESVLRKLIKAELPAALSKVFDSLTLRQKQLCKLLGEDGLNIKQVSEFLNIPRTSIYDEIGRIREIFRKEGLDDYLRSK